MGRDDLTLVLRFRVPYVAALSSHRTVSRSTRCVGHHPIILGLGNDEVACGVVAAGAAQRSGSGVPVPAG